MNKNGDVARRADAHTQSRDPFAQLAAMRERMRGADRRASVDATRVKQLLESAAVLEGVNAWAAEMQLGADGFDNTTASRRYAEVQKRLRAAAREIAAACEVLVQDVGLRP